VRPLGLFAVHVPDLDGTVHLGDELLPAANPVPRLTPRIPAIPA
jgi:hypothetical protein